MRWRCKEIERYGRSRSSYYYCGVLLQVFEAPETDSLNLPIDADGYITIFDGRAWTDGVDTVRIKCLPGGLLRMVASNSVEPVPVKDRPVKVVT